MGYGKRKMQDALNTKMPGYGHGGYVSDAMKDRAQGFGIQNPSSSPFTCGSKKKKRKK